MDTKEKDNQVTDVEGTENTSPATEGDDTQATAPAKEGDDVQDSTPATDADEKDTDDSAADAQATDTDKDDSADKDAKPASKQTYQIFIGNISWDANNEDLVQLCEDHNLAVATGENAEGIEYKRVKILKDRETGRSRGFGFIHFDTAEAAAEAIQKLNGVEFMGRELRVDKAKEREPRRNDRRGGGRGRGNNNVFGRNAFGQNY